MKLKLFATYRELTGCKEMEVPNLPDVWSLLQYLGERYGPAIREKLFTPDGGDIGREAILLVNGRHVQHLQGKDTPLSDGDIVALFPMVAGG